MATVVSMQYFYSCGYVRGYEKREEQMIAARKSGKAITIGKITVARGIRGENLIFIEEDEDAK